MLRALGAAAVLAPGASACAGDEDESEPRASAFPDGRYTPLVVDGQQTYIVGRNKVYAFAGR